MSTDLEEIRRTALHLTNCVNALVDDDLALASKHSKVLRSSKSPLHAAVIARVLLKEKKLESAAKFFQKAADGASTRSNDKHQYIRCYSLAFLAAISERKEEAANLIDQALSFKPNDFVFRCLPLFPMKDWLEQ